MDHGDEETFIQSFWKANDLYACTFMWPTKELPLEELSS